MKADIIMGIIAIAMMALLLSACDIRFPIYVPANFV